MIAIDDEMRAAIERRIAESLRSDNPRLRAWWELMVTRQALPVEIGWTASVALCPDGTFLLRDDEETGAVTELVDPYWARIALCNGVKRYPELAPLLPSRPAAARDCENCAQLAALPAMPGLLCCCGGLGWLLPGEPTRSI
jgi:hypothetical protein